MTPNAPSSSPRHDHRQPWWLAWASLVAALALFEFTPLDLVVQDWCYDFAAGRWVVDGNEPVGRFWFYNGPKFGVILTGVGLIALGLGPARWRVRLGFGRRAIGVAVLTLATVPALVGFGKSTTNIFFPSEIRRYGGDVPYVRLFEAHPAQAGETRRGHGFPAGHASGGFALIALAGLRPERRWRLFGWALGLGAGWWMGGYQMLKGAHYLSHTVVTMVLAWIILLAWQRILDRAEAK